MKKVIKDSMGVILMSLVELAVGVLLLIDPVSFTTVICVIAGVTAAAVGIMCLVKYFTLSPEEASAQQQLFKGLSAIALGALCIFNTGWIVSNIMLLSTIYGLAVLFAGISKVQWAVDMVRMHVAKWFLPAIGAVLSITLAVLILTNPFGNGGGLWVFTGIALVFESVYDIVILIISKRESADTKEKDGGLSEKDEE